MIVGHRKPLEEIVGMVEGLHPLLVLGCGGCTSVCLAGGQREVEELCRDLQDHFGQAGKEILLGRLTIERQCNAQFFGEVDRRVGDYRAVLSLACGAGVQFTAERYPNKPVLPALDTDFVGIDRETGWFEENCRTCGDCVLGETGGVCPVTRCAKSLFNGPCGGTRADGACEVDQSIPCAWFEIHRRLRDQGRLELIRGVRPIRDWRNLQRRTLIQEPFRDRYQK
jgi:ferredoxin